MLKLFKNGADPGNVKSVISRYMKDGAEHPEVLLCARGILESSADDPIVSVYKFAKENIAYVPDPGPYTDNVPRPDATELFTAPWKMVELIFDPASTAVGDCVTGDVPVWIKRGSIPELVEIQELLPLGAHYAQYSGVEILAPTGFVPLVSVRRKAPKPVLRLLSTSDFSCTPDHKVVIEAGRHGYGRYAAAKDTEPNNLLRYYPPAESMPVVEGGTELAWAYGLFFTDGSISRRSQTKLGGEEWRITNGDAGFLERAQAAFTKEYPTIKFNINTFPSYSEGAPTNYGPRRKSLYCLDAGLHSRADHGIRGPFIREFAKDIYTSTGSKKVPQAILCGGKPTAKSFLDGAWAGNGCINDPTRRISIHRKISTMGLSYLIHRLGGAPFVGADHDSVRIHGRIKEFSPRHKWREAGSAPVYDVATATGEFVAGDIAVKNCDDSAIFVATLLRALGYRSRVVLLAVHGEDYDHAASQVWMDSIKEWVFIDPTNVSNPMGWVIGYNKIMAIE